MATTITITQPAAPVTLNTSQTNILCNGGNTGANGANIITLSPASADSINGRVSTAAADSTAGGVVNKDFVKQRFRKY